MSAILRLYPRAWRVRYGDELAALLEEQPATLTDSLDLIRGAIDARLHPQVPGTTLRPDKEIPMHVRLLGAAAAIGGAVWILAIISAFILPRDPDGNRDLSLAFLGFAAAVALTGVALGELGSRKGSRSSARTGHVIAAISVATATLVFMPWPILVIPLYAFPVFAFFAALRATGNGAIPAWVAPLFGITGLASIVGFSGSIEDEAQLILVTSTGWAALVLAWVAFSGRAAEPQVESRA